MRANVLYIGHQQRCKTVSLNTSAKGLDGQSKEEKQNAKRNQDSERNQNSKRNLANSKDHCSSRKEYETAVKNCVQNSQSGPQEIKSKIEPPLETETKENNYSSTFSVIHSMIKNLISSGPALLRPIAKASPQSIAESANQSPQDSEFDRPDSDKENRPPVERSSALSKLGYDRGERRILIPHGQVRILSNGQVSCHEQKAKINGHVHSTKKVKHSSEFSKTVLSKVPVTGDPIDKFQSKPGLNSMQLRRSTRGESSQRNTCASLMQLHWFFELLEEPMVNRFLEADVCHRYADKYLLAMVFTYFVRSQFEREQFNKKNFFAALYLAHDMEEDMEELKYEVFPWALGHRWRHTFTTILQLRDDIFWKIDCRATVSRKCCEQVMDMAPHHRTWKRERPDYHGGAIRNHLRHPTDDGHPRGPNKSPLQCLKCLERSCWESDNSYLLYDSAEAFMTCSEKDSDSDENEDSGFQTLLCNQSDVGTSLLQAEATETNISSLQKKSVLVRDCLSLPRASQKSNGADTDLSVASDLPPIPLKTHEIRVVGNELEEMPFSQADTVMLEFVLSQEN